jgi:transposase
MPHIDYPKVIKEGQEELQRLEKRHRYTHLFHRVKMLRLLKSGECSNLGEAAQELGYSWRQCQRWFATYREGGLEELLISRVGERGSRELITDKAWEELEEVMKRGEIATIVQAHRFLLARGIEYAHPESVGQLLKRRHVKLKSGRPRHRKANPQEQQRFKKSSPRTSGGEKTTSSSPKKRRSH